MINNYTLNDLYKMYLDRQFEDIEQIVQDSKVYELKRFAKDYNLVWYQGSKASFLQQLRIHLAQRRIIVGGSFSEPKTNIQ